MERTKLRGGYRAAALMAVLIMGASVAACSSSGSSGSTSSGSSGSSSGAATIDMGSPPNSLDPQVGYTIQAGEVDWITYTPLLTYAHKNGLAGTQIIPGLAQALPVVSNGGRTYTLTLRPGLKYSNGQAVKAGDFTYAIERALKLDWGASSFLLSIAGSGAYQDGQASTISGISTNDATRTITINLTSPVGDFPNVLAFPATSPVPQSTPMKTQTTTMPPGVGPYVIKDVVPNVSWELVKNPLFASFHIPGIPLGHISTFDFQVVSNPVTEAENVLNNQADSFDVGDAVPAAMASQIATKARGRFQKEVVASTNYFFLNQALPPFNNILAREAANYAIDRQALARLAGGYVTPSCYFLPVGIPGHPTAPCPFASPNLPKARALLKQANLVGAKVSVYGFTGAPASTEAQYYASALNSVGFNATLHLINPSIYWTTIGNAQTKSDTGEAGQFLDFPNPADFYLLLDGRSIHPVHSNNFGNVNDPHIQAMLIKLEQVPSTQLSTVVPQWTALDEYAANKAYYIVWGSNELVKFLSDRINFGKAVFQPLFFDDYSTWQFNSGS
jgi:peptide/nickel transport system substrate-binding protein